MLKEKQRQMSDSWQRVEEYVVLLKDGGPSSLAQLRRKLGVKRKDVAERMGVTEGILGRWERGDSRPSVIQLARWRIKMSDYMDEHVLDYLGTDSPEVLNKFWGLLWELSA